MPHGLTVIRELHSCLRQAAPPAERLVRALCCLDRHLGAAESALYLCPPEELFASRFAVSCLDSQLPATLPRNPLDHPPDGARLFAAEGPEVVRVWLAVRGSAWPVWSRENDFWMLATEMLARFALVEVEVGKARLEARALLNRTVRGLMYPPQVNRQMVLLLAVLTSRDLGLFEQAMLFMVNRRAGSLQGMLGMTRKDAERMLGEPSGDPDDEWPQIPLPRQQQLLEEPLAAQVRTLRFPFVGDDNPLARAALQRQMLICDNLGSSGAGGRVLTENLGLRRAVCLPLMRGDEVMAVVLLDPGTVGAEMPAEMQGFLERLAHHAGRAFVLSSQFEHLEQSLHELREVQERQIQQERVEAVGEVSAAVAHELRNPLVTVGGFARRLAWSLPDGTQEKEYAQIVAREVQRVEEMLGNILAFSRGNLACFAPCRYDEIARAVVELYTHPFEEKGVAIHLSATPDLPELVADAQQLRQVLENLLNNAAAVLVDGGEVSVSLEACTVRHLPGIELTVEDSGGGIPADVLRNIFNPFFTTRSEGTGLGLSIVQRIVEHHHGEIEVFNAERGARFRVRIPEAPPVHGMIDNPGAFG